MIRTEQLDKFVRFSEPGNEAGDKDEIEYDELDPLSFGYANTELEALIGERFRGNEGELEFASVEKGRAAIFARDFGLQGAKKTLL